MNEEKELGTKSRASRDPAGRRKAIVNACADLIVSEGIRKITNRRVADLAGVPLGSTTQYFKSVDDLRYAGLMELAERVDQEYESMFKDFNSNDFNAAVFSKALIDFFSNEQRVQAAAELYAAAIDDVDVRAITKRSHKAFTKHCSDYIGEKRMGILEAFIEGALVYACINGKSLDESSIKLAMELILAEE